MSLTPEVTSRGVRRAVIRELVIQYQDSELGGKLPVYDGNKVRKHAGSLLLRTLSLLLSCLPAKPESHERVFRKIPRRRENRSCTWLYRFAHSLQGSLVR